MEMRIGGDTKVQLEVQVDMLRSVTDTTRSWKHKTSKQTKKQTDRVRDRARSGEKERCRVREQESERARKRKRERERETHQAAETDRQRWFRRH